VREGGDAGKLKPLPNYTERQLHALEKLSARSGPRGTVDDDDEDLAMLLKGEDGHDATSFDGGLGELLLRLQLSKPRTFT
jgi:hypothetical protein